MSSTRPLASLALLVLLSCPGVARAEVPERVLSLDNDFIVLPPPPGAEFAPADDSPWQVVYLNFDGATLKAGPSDSKNNTTGLIDVATLDYPAMTWTNLGGKEQGMKAVIDELKLIFMKFAVKFVSERPTEGDYTMAMVGGDGAGCKKAGADTVGIAPLDCDNSNRNDITLIYGEAMSSSAKKLALVIAHELGHTFGLEHVSDSTGIMYPALAPEVCCWVSSPLSEGSVCGRQSQDDEEILRNNVGAGKQDTLPPLVWFKRPGPDAVLPPDFSFEVTAADDLAVHHVVVYLDGNKVLELSDPPYTKALTGIADGGHVLKAEVHDWAQQQSTTEVSFSVDSKCVIDGTCYAGPGGTDSECASAGDCASGLCAVDEQGAGVCVEACEGEATEAICPKGTVCEDGACLPRSFGSGEWKVDQSGGDGGCNLGRPPAGLPAGLILLGLALLARRRR